MDEAEADIEDMFEPGFYLRLVKGEYREDLTKKPTINDLSNKHPRILIRLQDFLDANPLKSGRRFSHYRPARFLNENLSTPHKTSVDNGPGQI